jgi:hypothetical protein
MSNGSVVTGEISSFTQLRLVQAVTVSPRKRFFVDWLEDKTLKLDIMSTIALTSKHSSDWQIRFEAEGTLSSRKRFFVD